MRERALDRTLEIWSSVFPFLHGDEAEHDVCWHTTLPVLAIRGQAGFLIEKILPKRKKVPLQASKRGPASIAIVCLGPGLPPAGYVETEASELFLRRVPHEMALSCASKHRALSREILLLISAPGTPRKALQLFSCSPQPLSPFSLPLLSF